VPAEGPPSLRDGPSSTQTFAGFLNRALSLVLAGACPSLTHSLCLLRLSLSGVCVAGLVAAGPSPQYPDGDGLTCSSPLDLLLLALIPVSDFGDEGDIAAEVRDHASAATLETRETSQSSPLHDTPVSAGLTANLTPGIPDSGPSSSLIPTYRPPRRRQRLGCAPGRLIRAPPSGLRSTNGGRDIHPLASGSRAPIVGTTPLVTSDPGLACDRRDRIRS